MTKRMLQSAAPFAALILLAAVPAIADTITVNQPGLGSTGNQLSISRVGDSQKAYVRADQPNSETAMRLDFRISAAAIADSPDGNKLLDIVRSFGPSSHHIRVVLQWKIATQNYKVVIFERDSGTNSYRLIDKITVISGTDTDVGIEWVASTGATSGDGELRLYKNGVLKRTKTNVNNDQVVNSIRVGSPNGSAQFGASTTFAIDEVSMTRI